jgi:metal-sulfur cluster biosynthetic enzyme
LARQNIEKVTGVKVVSSEIFLKPPIGTDMLTESAVEPKE